MRHAVVIQHVAFEDLGHIAPLLDARGYRVTCYRPPTDEVWTVDPAQLDLLIVLGGPMSANDHVHEGHIADTFRLVAAARARRVPVLGICLGAQIIALAAGGTVTPMPDKEIGLAPVTLSGAAHATPLRHLAAGQPVLHWHGEAITAPVDATVLASTDHAAVQAFILPGHVLGLQFHLEADLRRIREWTQGHAGEVREAGIDVAALHAAADVHDSALRATCHAVVDAWLASLPA